MEQKTTNSQAGMANLEKVNKLERRLDSVVRMKDSEKDKVTGVDNEVKEHQTKLDELQEQLAEMKKFHYELIAMDLQHEVGISLYILSTSQNYAIILWKSII